MKMSHEQFFVQIGLKMEAENCINALWATSVKSVLKGLNLVSSKKKDSWVMVIFLPYLSNVSSKSQNCHMSKCHDKGLHGLPVFRYQVKYFLLIEITLKVIKSGKTHEILLGQKDGGKILHAEPIFSFMITFLHLTTNHPQPE